LVFGDPCGAGLGRGEPTECTVGPVGVVLDPPGFDNDLDLDEGAAVIASWWAGPCDPLGVRVVSLVMSALGWVIVAVVVIIIVAVVFVRRRRRGGGVIATRDKQ
jgi:hypothetical protein